MTSARRTTAPWELLILLGSLFFLLQGCTQKVDWDATQRQASVSAGDLYAGHTVGQTFACQHDGLNGVEVQWLDYGAESGRPAVPIEIILYRDGEEPEPVGQWTAAPEEIEHSTTFRMSFPAEPASAGRTYRIQASARQTDTPARATLWAHPDDLYPGGTLLRDGQPAAGDLAFSTSYRMDAGAVTRSLLHRAGSGLRHLPALLVLLLAPGYLLARWLPRSRQDDLLSVLGICLALSVGSVPLLLLLLSQLPLQLSGLAVRLAGAGLGAVALGLLIWDLRRGRWRGLALPSPVLLAAAGIVGVGLFLRALHVLDLAGPPWVDAVHHSLLARLIVERGAIPTDYRPYADVAPATYHFGFQSMVAVLYWLTGMPLQRALLVLGQTLSGLVGLPLYSLGKRWGGSSWAGLAAALAPTALLWMPSYLTSWSRYTQLAGLFLLPAAILLVDRLIRAGTWSGGAVGATAVALGGLLVTHLRVAAYAAVWAGLILLHASVRRRYHGGLMLVPWLRLLAAASIALAVTWPWLWPSVQHLWLPAARSWPATTDSLSLYYLRLGAGRCVLPVALFGIAWGLLRRRWQALLLAGWVGLLVLLANPRLVGITIGSVADNLSLDISMYVPLSLGLALAVGSIPSLPWRISRQLRSWLRWGGALLLVGVSLWGAGQTREVINSRTTLLTEADLEAISWIEQNTPPQAAFLINAYEWLTPVYAGSDGGYWISPLAGRRTWPPPALYGLGSSSSIHAVNEVVRAALAAPDSESLWALLGDHGITHVYVGRYGGTLVMEKLDQPWFRLVYQQGGVSIFEREP